MPRGNLENLIKNSDLTPEERSQKARKAGKASAAKRREKKEMKDRLNEILSMAIASGKTEDFKNLQEVNGKNLSVMDTIILSQIKKAMKGDTRSAEFIRDTAGMKPVDKKEVKNEIHSDGKLQDILDALNADDEE